MAANESLVYFGTYTGGKSKGIYVSRFDADRGKLSAPELAAEAKNPTFLCLHTNGQILYAVAELGQFEGKPAGGVSAFRIQEGSGKLVLLNQQPSGGTGPCHLDLDKSGQCLLVANYGSGSIAAFPIEADGKIGEAKTKIQHAGSSVDKNRQTGPHAHFISTDAANRFALVCDLGLDKVLVYKIDPARSLLETNDPAFVSIKAGAGPRHVAFHPDGAKVYVVNEMGSSLTALEYDAKRGAMKELQTISTLPENFAGHNSGAEVQVHPSGRFVYASNRGHNSIAVFAVDGESGKVKPVDHVWTHGTTPRHFGIDPTGKWLLAENQDADNVVVFKIDLETGRLAPTGQTVEVGRPVCAVFAPAGRK